MDDRQIRQAFHAMVTLIALLLPAAIFLCGCSHKVYVPVESVRTDTLYLSLHRDSIHAWHSSRYAPRHHACDSVWRYMIVWCDSKE